MSDAWSKIALRYAKVTDDVRKRFLHQAIEDAIQTDVPERFSCLDYGCGPGDLAIRIANLFDSLVLVDSAPDALAEASKKLGSTVVTLNPSEFFATDDVFDTVIFSLVLTTISSDSEVEFILCNLASRIKNGGRVIIGTTHPCFTFSAHSQVPYSSSGKPYTVQVEPGLEITEYHRPLSCVLDLLAKANLRILRTREVYDDPAYYVDRGEEPRRFAGALPMFLVMTCDSPS